jgi:hypothetical protein
MKLDWRRLKGASKARPLVSESRNKGNTGMFSIHPHNFAKT